MKAVRAEPIGSTTQIKEIQSKCIGTKALKPLNTLFENTNWKVLEEKREEGFMRIGGRFQLADKKNGNGRVYPRSLWEKVMEDPEVVEAIQSRRMVGELEHPGDGNTNLNRVSHLITALELRDDGEVYGEAEIFSTPAGKIAQELMRRGVRIGISSRGRGSSSTKSSSPNGMEEVVDPEDFKLETFDLVYNPSTPGAFPKKMESLQESGPGLGVEQMKELRERLKQASTRAVEISRLLETASAAALGKYMDECIDFQIDAQKAMNDEPALKPLAEELSEEASQLKAAIQARLDGSDKRLDEELRRHLGGNEKSESQETATGTKSERTVTIPASVLEGVMEQRARDRRRLEDLQEMASAPRMPSPVSVSPKRYKAALGLIEALIRKGRSVREERDSSRLNEEDLFKLLDGLVKKTEQRQVRIATEALIRRHTFLEPYREMLGGASSAQEVRSTAKAIIEARVKEGRNPKPKGEEALPTKGARGPKRLSITESGPRNSRGLQVAAQIIKRIGGTA